MENNLNSNKFSATDKSNNTTHLPDFTSVGGGVLKKLILFGLLGLAAIIISSCRNETGVDENVGTENSADESADPKTGTNTGPITVTFVSGPGARFLENVWYDMTGDAINDIGEDVTFPVSGDSLKRPTNPRSPTNYQAKLTETFSERSYYNAYFLGWYKTPKSTDDDQKWVFEDDTSMDGNKLSENLNGNNLTLYAQWKKTTEQPTDLDELKGLIANNNPTDTIDTSRVSDMSGLFKGSTITHNISGWDTSNVKVMKEMFSGAAGFNQNISGWNTAKVIDMSNMFNGAVKFSANIGGWNTAKVSNMSNMFNGAVKFSANIGDWNTAKVSNMSNMFNGNVNFNGNIGGWNTSGVTAMNGMFSGAAAFNRDLSWDTSSVVNMSNMFSGAAAFNRDLSWDTANVTNMSGQFSGAAAFNRDLSWDTANVTNMSGQFSGAAAFNRDLNWNTANVTNMDSMFKDAAAFNGNISGWNTAKVTDMSDMFKGAAVFNQNIGSWKVLKNTQFMRMFQNAPAFNANLSAWRGSCVNLDLTDMFSGSAVTAANADAYKNAIETLCEGKITFIPGDFAQFTKNVWYNQSVDRGAEVTITWSSDSYLKKGALLKQPTNPKPPTNLQLDAAAANPTYKAYFLGWFRDNTTDPAKRWHFGDPSNGKISSKSLVLYAQWKKTTVQPADLVALKNLISNNTPPDTIDTSKIGDMSGLFKGRADNPDISGWDISNVVNMKEMFSWATGFNNNIGGWNTAKVTDMASMFSGAAVFNHDLSGWNSGCVNLNTTDMFTGAPTVNTDTAKAIHDKCKAEVVFFTGEHATFVNNIFYPTNKATVNSMTEVRFDMSPDATLKKPTNPKPPSNLQAKLTDSAASNAAFKAYFLGWYTAPAGGNKWNFEADVIDENNATKDTLRRTVGLYARWSPTTRQAQNNVAVDPSNPKIWDISNVNGKLLIDKTQLSTNTNSVNDELDGWDISNVTNFHSFFMNVHQFNGNITGWNTSSVTTMKHMFENAYVFNRDITGWDVSNVTDLAATFGIAKKFNQDISKWDLSSAAQIDHMFYGAEEFEYDVSTWKPLCSGLRLEKMFFDATAYLRKFNVAGTGHKFSSDFTPSNYYKNPEQLPGSACTP